MSAPATLGQYLREFTHGHARQLASAARSNTHLKRTLGITAMAASRTKGTFFATRYRRVMSRRGHGRALVALTHTILTTCWHVFIAGQPYMISARTTTANDDQEGRSVPPWPRLGEAGCTLTNTDAGIFITHNW